MNGGAKDFCVGLLLGLTIGLFSGGMALAAVGESMIAAGLMFAAGGASLGCVAIGTWEPRNGRR